jgi:hypothetical protein
MQGSMNWYYLDSTGAQLVADSTDGYWQGGETYLRLWSNGGHPGRSADAVRRWIAPKAGTVHIGGNAHDLDTTCGSGVVVLIKQDGNVLWQSAIANGDTVGATFNMTVSVSQGSAIDFIINQGSDGDNYCDSTYFDPTITLQ